MIWTGASVRLKPPGVTMVAESLSSGRIVRLALVFEGGLAVLALVLGWLLGHPAADGLRWDPLAAARGAAASLPLALVLLAIVRWPLGPLQGFKHLVEHEIVPLFQGCTTAELGMISILAGIGEELLFRGLVQGGLAGTYGDWTALAIASILFGLAHAITAPYALLAGLIGAYLGWLFVAGGNLLVPMIAHALYDFWALVYLVRVRRRSSTLEH